MGQSLSHHRLIEIVGAQNEIASANLGAHEVMTLVAARARMLTGAEAAAVELLDRGGLVFQCGSGATEDQEAAYQAGAASMVSAPLCHRGRVLGALKLYARHSFDKEQVACLELLGGILAPHLAQWRESERRKHESTLDPLTGLPNRRAFEARLGTELARVRRHGGDLAVCLVDIDAFRQVNGSLGRAVGDEVLRGVARNLAEVRGEDEVFRLDGDEFALVLAGVDSRRARAAARRVAERVMRDPGCGGVTVSWGVAGPASGDPVAVVATATEALEQAKRAGSL